MVIFGSKFSQAGRDIGAGAFKNLLYPPGQAIGFVNSTNFGIAIAGTQETCKLAVAIQAFVIHFDDQDMIKPRENVLEARRQRTEVLDMQCRNAVSGGSRAVNRLVDGTLR